MRLEHLLSGEDAFGSCGKDSHRESVKQEKSDGQMRQGREKVLPLYPLGTLLSFTYTGRNEAGLSKPRDTLGQTTGGQSPIAQLVRAPH